jgi:hypothetical protein
MRQKILFLVTLLVCNTALADSINTIILNNSNVFVERNNQAKYRAELQVHVGKDEIKSSYKYDIRADAKLIDAAQFNKKIIVVTQIHNTYQVLIIDSKTGKVIDNFWSAFTKVSPNGRFIVFTRWQGKGIQPNDPMRTGETRIYDVTKSPLENRTKADQQHFKRKPVSLSNHFKESGIPIYPKGDYEKPNYGFITRKEESAAVYGEYHWYTNSAFIFSTTPYNNEPKLINVQFNHASNEFEVEEQKLKIENLLPRGSKASPSLQIWKIDKTNKYITIYTQDAIIKMPNTMQVD